MGKVVGAISLSLVLASAGAAWSQEIGIVSAAPNAVTGDLLVDIPVRPDGEKVYIVRNGTLVTEATIKSSGGQAGTVISLPTGQAASVQVGDRVSLSPTLDSTLPASAYEVKVAGDVLPPSPGQKQLAATFNVSANAEVGAPEPPAAAAVAEPVQLEKGDVIAVSQGVAPVMANPTPRSMGIPLFPAPAQTEGGVTAPYGQGLAAAAPVGTPYLRSPAFAGPPIIYMPQTVTRVLLPGATPYPSNIMSPPSNYIYASAPFLRTDIYTSLPYGTFYWPQGYAGTTPVEPQVPAYVTAPSAALVTASTEADYTSARYAPGVANVETLNPIASGLNANVVASTSQLPQATTDFPGAQATGGLTVASPDASASFDAGFNATAPAEVNPFPVLSDTSVTPAPLVPTPEVPAFPTMGEVQAFATPAITPSVPGASSPLPSMTPAVAPAAPDAAPAGLPDLPAAMPGDSSAAPQGLPELPADSTQVASALPTLPEAAPTPASMMPSLPTPAVPPAPVNEIIVDDKTPGGVTLEPADAWIPSANTAESHQGESVTATVDPNQPRSATFNATIPVDGQYEVSLWWVKGIPQFRSNAVPVTIHTATGPQQTTIDQTQGDQWNVLGTYALKAGQNVPVVTISTEGLTATAPTVSVSVDALKLTPQ